MERFEEYLKTQLLFSNQLALSISKALLVNSPVSNRKMDCTSQARIANIAADNKHAEREGKGQGNKILIELLGTSRKRSWGH